MKLELTKAQAKHLEYLLKEDRDTDQAMLNDHTADKRYVKNSLNLNNRILTKLTKEVA
jgi:hypothetical protein